MATPSLPGESRRADCADRPAANDDRVEGGVHHGVPSYGRTVLASTLDRTRSGSDQMEPAGDVDGTIKLESAKRQPVCPRLSNSGFRQES